VGVITPHNVLDALEASLDDDRPARRIAELIESSGLPVRTAVDASGSLIINVDDDGSLLAPYLVALCAIVRLAAVADEPLSEVFLSLKGDLLHDPEATERSR